MALVLTTRDPIEFTVGDVKFVVQALCARGDHPVKLWIKAPQEVGVQRLNKDVVDARSQCK